MADPETGRFTRLSEGMGLDGSALATVWLGDHPRTAVEFGVEARLDEPADDIDLDAPIAVMPIDDES